MRLITTYRTNEMLIRHPGRWRIDVYQALLPFIVISRTECTEVVVRINGMAVIWYFIGGTMRFSSKHKRRCMEGGFRGVCLYQIQWKGCCLIRFQ